MSGINESWLKSGVFMGSEVHPSRIARDVVIHPGCRIQGIKTSIGPGCVVGAETPATIENCQLGRNVELKGGFFSGATFFDGSNMGSGAHVRAGTTLEEEANGAHTVGLKQTLLMPFVTLGSLINFCDVLMAGGTNRKNHSEVGSSYIHFNYTPHQDKATASLVGEVPEGVFLDKAPIFLGGQGGLVGPSRIAYGSVVAAGGVCRQDVLEENQLHIPAAPASTTRPYASGSYRKIGRIVENNLRYIGNIVALREWYRTVRQPLMCRDTFDVACYEGGLENIERILAERIGRLDELAQKMVHSIHEQEYRPDMPKEIIAEQQLFHSEWENIAVGLRKPAWPENTDAKEAFLASMKSVPTGGAYIETIQSLNPETRNTGRIWLQSMVDEAVKLWPPQLN